MNQATNTTEPSTGTNGLSEATHCCPPSETPLTFGSLFAGIGGIDLGFERAGLKCRWQVEIDEYARKVLAKHWPDVRRHDDVRTWPTEDAEYVDIIAGGFPCQDISIAGRREGIEGKRSGLWSEFRRIVGDLRPRFVVVENVSALLIRGMDRVLGDLAELGYDAEWDCIPAAAVGAPHLRKRIFIVAHAESIRRPLWQTARERQGRLAGSGDEGNNASGRRHRASNQAVRSRWGAIELSDWWETEPAVGRLADGVPARVDRLRGLGNAVVPQVAEWIARRIVEAHAQPSV